MYAPALLALEDNLNLGQFTATNDLVVSIGIFHHKLCFVGTGQYVDVHVSRVGFRETVLATRRLDDGEWHHVSRSARVAARARCVTCAIAQRPRDTRKWP